MLPVDWNSTTPTPPAALTVATASTGSMKSQATILPLTLAGSRLPDQQYCAPSSSDPAWSAKTMGVLRRDGSWSIDVPTMRVPSPSRTVASWERSTVAPTVVTHGSALLTIPDMPSLPAAAATKTPAR